VDAGSFAGWVRFFADALAVAGLELVYWDIYMTSRFTFCIPNLNKIEFLPACIESMLAQDCDDWCCVFVDGFSTDGCWEYMQRFADDPRFRLLRGLKNGMYADWNYCLQHVETEYFYILTSDDTCYPKLASKTMSALDNYSDIDVCHFKFALIDRSGDIIRTSPEVAKLQFPLYAPFYEQAHRRMGLVDFVMHFAYGALYTTITSLVFRRRVIENLGGFGLGYGSVSDYDWTMRLGLYSDVLYVPDLLATWRKYGEQADAQTNELDRRSNEFKIAQKNLDLFLNDKQFIDLTQSYCIQSRRILDGSRDGYSSARYAAAISQMKDSLVGGIKSASEATLYDPTYVYRKLIRRISQNKFFIYDRDLFLKEIFNDLELNWKPNSILFDIAIGVSSHD
jgi:glycosyltransferase involved in cell wall biosynthesis